MPRFTGAARLVSVGAALTEALTAIGTTDLAGTTNAQAAPDATTTVHFSTSNISGSGTLATTLETPFNINALVFNGQTQGGQITAISIAPGAAGTLTITPSSSTVGIDMQDRRPGGRDRFRPRSPWAQHRPGTWRTAARC